MDCLVVIYNEINLAIVYCYLIFLLKKEILFGIVGNIAHYEQNINEVILKFNFNKILLRENLYKDGETVFQIFRIVNSLLNFRNKSNKDTNFIQIEIILHVLTFVLSNSIIGNSIMISFKFLFLYHFKSIYFFLIFITTKNSLSQ